MSKGGDLWEVLQRARMELRHQAHIYVGCKNKDKSHRDRAAEGLEQAALTVAFAMAQYGAFSDCARPAGKAGEEWKERFDPENMLRVWQEGLPAEDAKREAGKIVDAALKRGR